MKWTCIGSVRGSCGIAHRTREASQAHCRQDNRDCKVGCGQNAYSDRYPHPLDAEAEAADDRERSEP